MRREELRFSTIFSKDAPHHPVGSSSLLKSHGVGYSNSNSDLIDVLSSSTIDKKLEIIESIFQLKMNINFESFFRKSVNFESIFELSVNFELFVNGTNV